LQKSRINRTPQYSSALSQFCPLMRVKTDFYVIMTCKQEKPFNQNGSPHLRVRAAVFLYIDSFKKGKIFIEKFTQISLDFFCFRDIIK
jgi:hypothetical protein